MNDVVQYKDFIEMEKSLPKYYDHGRLIIPSDQSRDFRRWMKRTNRTPQEFNMLKEPPFNLVNFLRRYDFIHYYTLVPPNYVQWNVVIWIFRRDAYLIAVKYGAMSYEIKSGEYGNFIFMGNGVFLYPKGRLTLEALIYALGQMWGTK